MGSAFFFRGAGRGSLSGSGTVVEGTGNGADVERATVYDIHRTTGLHMERGRPRAGRGEKHHGPGEKHHGCAATASERASAGRAATARWCDICDAFTIELHTVGGPGEPSGFGRYQAAPGAPLGGARVPRRPWAAPTTIPGVGKGLKLAMSKPPAHHLLHLPITPYPYLCPPPL